VSKLVEAREHHKAGRLGKAEQIYHEILRSQPHHPDALHLLGVIAVQRAQPAHAVDLIEKAIRLNPTEAAYHSNLGEALRAQGQLDTAISAYRQALAIRFDNDTLDNLAQALCAQGLSEQAIDFYLRALNLRPEDTQARRGLLILLRTVRPTGSWAELEQVLSTYYRSADIDHQQLAGITANQLRHKYGLPKRLPLTEADNSTFLDALSSDQLLLALLTKTVNVDYEFERFLTELRRCLLLTYHQAPRIPKAHVALVGALAQQCFNNEYVFNTDAEEARTVEELTDVVCATLNGDDESLQLELESQLLLLECYVSLESLRCAPQLATLNTTRWSPVSQALVERTLIEPSQEREIEKNIESLGEIDDPTSRAVRAQYEENPYPRWLDIGRSDQKDLTSMRREQFPHVTPPAFLSESMRILVAGCGTGQEPISFALKYRNSEVVAVDLSRRSLAYGARMAHKLGVTNVRFLQADILNLEKLAERFHIISSAGVLHHMTDPIAGWRVLVDRLVPSGLMQVNLYSESARRPLAVAQEEIKRRGLKPIAEDIRSFRTLVLSGAFNSELTDFTAAKDFYTLSGCRDLLFHVKEHRFTIAQIREALGALGLELIGFDLSKLHIPQHFQERSDHDSDMNDFATCERLEQLYPRAFLSMYRFWCHKT
jgi:SAM-dependent methyltransferase/tetratricopeptide (TPR) repeat protein